jgi:hypothetical protein
MTSWPFRRGTVCVEIAGIACGQFKCGTVEIWLSAVWQEQVLLQGLRSR